MQRPRRPFDIALLAMILALGLPIVVFMFGAIRARQLQSKANPRWAQFAKVTGPAASNDDSSSESGRISVRTASMLTEQLPVTTPSRQEIPETSLTGSVSGHSTIEFPVNSQPSATAVVDDGQAADRNSVTSLQAIIFRPVDDQDDRDSKIAETARRLETHLTQLRQRLDQLAHRQQQYQSDVIQRETQFLEALRRLSQSPKRERGAEQNSPFDESQVPQTLSSETVPVEAPSTDPPAAEVPARKPDAPSDADENPVEDLLLDKPTQLERVIPDPRHVPVQPVHPQSVNGLLETPIDIVPELKNQINAPPTTNNSQVDESIRIRRETAPDRSNVFTMDAKDADIREFFRKLSEVAHVSILLSPEINGQISLNVQSASFESVLKAILKSRDYSFEREGEIIIISTAHEASRLKHDRRKLIMKIYQPSYLSAAELNRLAEPLLSPDGRHAVSTPGHSGLSAVDGQDLADDIVTREALIVQDVEEVLGRIDQILVEMDVPPLQVNIEAKILCVRLSGRLEHGIDLGLLPCQRDSGASFAEGGLKHANLSCNVPTFIKSIEQLADTSVVTSQRIQVLNKHRAEMLIGDRIGYQSKAGENVRFMESGTRLIMRPSISADGCIRVEIHPERSSVAMTRRAKLPVQTTAELTTQVLIHDGATVAIGGLISEQAIETTRHIPVISSIPVVGAPFRHRNERLQRTELIILVTPRIVTDCSTEADGAYQEQAAEQRAVEFRNQQSDKSRHNLARAHYNRAACYLQHGNPVKARQQIDASLHLNKADLDALRLRNEISQCFTHAAAQ